jgi:hypothetical protein
MRIAFASLVIVSVLLVGCGGGGNDGAGLCTISSAKGLSHGRIS